MRADRTALTVNKLWRELFGADALQQPAGGVPEAVLVGLEGSLRAGTTDLGEIELVAPAAIGFGRFAIVPVVHHADAAEAVIIVCVDVTKEVIGRRLSVSADAIMWTGDSSGSIERANDAWYVYTGASSAPSWL